MRYSKVVIACSLWLIATRAPVCVGQPVTGSGAVDVIVIVDDSGSMRRSDPRFLIRPAIMSFEEHLPPGSRFGLFTFDRTVTELLNLSDLSALDFQRQLTEALGRISYRGRFSDIPAAIERAIYAIRESPNRNSGRAIVVITDGVVETGDPTKDLERSRWLRLNLADEALGRNIHIFGIALTESADFELLQSLALTTQATYFRAATADKLSAALGQVSAALKTSTSPPSNSQPTSASARRLTRTALSGLMLGVFFGVVLAIALFLVVRYRRAVSSRGSLSTSERDGPKAASRADTFDVFICYNTADKKTVEKIDAQLRRRGIRPWFDQVELPAGGSWRSELVRNLRRIRSAAVFIGDESGPWNRAEIEELLAELAQRGCPIIPVKLTPRADLSSLPMFLRSLTVVDLSRDDQKSMEQLVWGITGSRRNRDMAK